MYWHKKMQSANFVLLSLIRAQVLEHYRLHHGSVSSVSPLPCLYDDCVCTFQSKNALKIHLTWVHMQTVVHAGNQMRCVSFMCPLCGFKQPFNDKTLLSHLRTHLKQHEMVDSKIATIVLMFILPSTHTKVRVIQTVMSRILRMKLS